MITDDKIIEISKETNLEPAALKAVILTESSGDGFLKSGKLKILFEGHIFWKELKLQNIKPETYAPDNQDILYPVWTKKYYKGGEEEYDRLERAIKINRIAALKSTSYGLFQIMGFNYKKCGYFTTQDMINDFNVGENQQIKAFITFISGSKYNALKNKDWATFAFLYNGSGYKKNQYDKKLENYYNKYIKLNEQLK